MRLFVLPLDGWHNLDYFVNNLEQRQPFFHREQVNSLNNAAPTSVLQNDKHMPYVDKHSDFSQTNVWY